MTTFVRDDGIYLNGPDHFGDYDLRFVKDGRWRATHNADLDYAVCGIPLPAHCEVWTRIDDLPTLTAKGDPR